MTRPYQLVDVFGEGPFSGNPVAVIAEAEGLSTQEMQRITRWLNLSETTFLLPPTDPGADYHVRIFTLDRELPFAGHPTLGTCHAWLQAGGTPRTQGTIVQQCGVGLVTVKREGNRLAFAAPPLVRSGPIDDTKLDEITHVLGIARSDIVASEWVDNGPGWAGILLESAEAVLALEPRRDHPHRIEIGIVGPHAPGGEVDWEVRAIFSGNEGSLIEDPVTGSLNASLAQWLLGSGRATAPYVAAQGTRLDRMGRVHVERDSDGAIWIGGDTVTMLKGTGTF